MTYTYPTAPEGCFFKIKRFTDEWSGSTFNVLQLRRKTWLFSRLVDAVHLPALGREAVADTANELLNRFPVRENYRRGVKDIPKINKILKENNK